MRRSLLLLAVLALMSVAAHASTLTYDVNLVTGSGMPYPDWHGTFTVDSTYGSLQSANFPILNVDFTTVDAGDTFDGANLTYFGKILFLNPAPGVYLYQTLNLAGGNYNFSVANGTIDYGTYSVSLQPTVAATPEPASLVLLGSGVLGVIGTARRRVVAA